MNQKKSINRRTALQRIGTLVGAVPIALTMGTTAARAGLSRKDVGYQLMPHGAQKCGLCASFIAERDKNGAGTCKIVDGSIPQNGWCPLFSKR